MKCKVVYACSHPTWLGETIRSANSCRNLMPEVPCEIWVTNELARHTELQLQTCFAAIQVIDRPLHAHRPKFESMLNCYADQALFIDGDTFFVASVMELFELLEHFDIALAPAPQYFHSQALNMKIYDGLPRVSTAIPEWNGGVIVARVTDRFRSFVGKWSELFTRCQQRGYRLDQAALRAALVTSDLRIATLPANYNFRANMAQTIKGEVKLLHAHGNLPLIASHINQDVRIRHYVPKPEEIDGFQPKSS